MKVTDIYPNYPLLGEHFTKPLEWHPPGPDHIKVYMSWPIQFPENHVVSFNDIKIKISDFGCSAFEDEEEEIRNQVGFGDITVVAPEALLGCTWDCTADLWSVGATVSQFVYDVANHF